MVTVYKVDSRKVFTGEVIEKGIKDVVKRDEIMVAPPEGEGFHIWDGHKWFTRQEYPYPVAMPVEPEPVLLLTLFEFRSRFTLAEKAAIQDERKNDTMLDVILSDMEAAQVIDLSNEQLQQGLQYIETKGLIAEGRAAEILA